MSIATPFPHAFHIIYKRSLSPVTPSFSVLISLVIHVVEMPDYTTPEAITESEEVCYEYVSSHDMKASSIQSRSNKASSMDKLFSILWRPKPIDDTLLV